MPDIPSLRGRLAIARDTLNDLEEQRVKFGSLYAPTYLLGEIRQTQRVIADVETQLRAVGDDPASVTEADIPLADQRETKFIPSRTVSSDAAPSAPTRAARIVQGLIFLVGGVFLAIVVNVLTATPQPPLDWIARYPYHFLGGTLVLLTLLSFVLERTTRPARQAKARYAKTNPINTDRQTLIHLVTNLLDQSEDGFERAVNIDLGITQVPALVASARVEHWGSMAARPLTEPLPDLLRRVKRLLVVGQPGAGKSATLRILCRDLLPLAADGLIPVPVIVNLASYGQHSGDILTWLGTRGLKDSLGIPPTIAHALLDMGGVLLLLDGLDEMGKDRRGGCIEGLNTLMEQSHPAFEWLVVACRRQEYDETGMPLGAHTALDLQPIGPTEISETLLRMGRSTAGLREALRREPALANVLDTPLMLNLAIKAYAGRSQVQVRGQTPEERLATLYRDYVHHMLVHAHHRLQHSPEQTLTWLRWLAQRMRDAHMVVFLVERLQPSWLDSQYSFRIVVMSVGGLIGGLIGGLFGGLLSGLIDGPGSGLLDGPSSRLLDMPSSPLSSGLLVGLVFGLIGGIGLGLNVATIRPVERLQWSTKAAYQGFLQMVRRIGLVFGLIGGLLGGLISGLVFGPRSGVIVGVALGLTSVGSGLLRGVIDGFNPMFSEQPLAPNAGVWASVRNGCIQMGVVGLVLGPFFGLVLGLLFGLRSGLIIGMFGGLFGGLLSGMFGGLGEALKHLILRIVLWREQHAPLCYIPFLESCRAVLLLRRRGGSYEFWHITLRDYLASLSDEQIRDLARGDEHNGP